MAHSNQVREFLITSKGVKLVPAYLGLSGVLTGSARLSQETRERIEKRIAREELQRKKLALGHRRRAIDAQILALQAGYKTEEEEFARIMTDIGLKERQDEIERVAMAKSRRIGQT